MGLVYYWSFRSGQQAIEQLVFDLSRQVNKQIDQHLDSYLSNIRKLNELNATAINAGLIDPSDRDNLARLFWQQVKLYDVGYILFSSVTGEHVDVGNSPDHSGLVTGQIDPQRYGDSQYYVYKLDQQGNNDSLLDSADYNLQTEGWYKDVIQAKHELWTSIYVWEEPSVEHLAIAVSSPVYDQAQNLLGVIAVEQRLSQISDFLSKLKVSPSVKVFIMERNGMTIASSSMPPFEQISGKSKRLQATDSADPVIQSTAKYLTKQFNDLESIQISQQLTVDIEGQQQFIRVTPWQDELGLDWLIVVAIPKSDFTEQINKNTRRTILLCTVALIVAIGIGIAIVQMITNSIRRLNASAKEIAAGNLEQTVDVKGIYELETLSRSYNQMVYRLQQSFTDLETANHELEQRVEERTAELQALNHELHLLSKVDGLTQVANRRFFDEYLVQEWKRFQIYLMQRSCKKEGTGDREN